MSSLTSFYLKSKLIIEFTKSALKLPEFKKNKSCNFCYSEIRNKRTRRPNPTEIQRGRQQPGTYGRRRIDPPSPRKDLRSGEIRYRSAPIDSASGEGRTSDPAEGEAKRRLRRLPGRPERHRTTARSPDSRIRDRE